MTSKNITARGAADLNFPATFFEDALGVLENTETQRRLKEIENKAQFMVALAERICDSVLRAEADKIARLAREKMALLPPDESNKTNRRGYLLRAACAARRSRAK